MQWLMQKHTQKIPGLRASLNGAQASLLLVLAEAWINWRTVSNETDPSTVATSWETRGQLKVQSISCTCMQNM